MVLLILVVVWAVVLGPSLLRRRAERRSTDSIGAFHRQLRILERTGPTLVDPAHRLGTSFPTGGLDTAGRSSSVATSRSGLMVVRPDAVGAGAPGPAGVRRPDPYFRPKACKRRRDVLMAVACVLTVTGLLGAIPVLRPMLVITGVCSLALVVYVGLLVHLRNLAMEREVKLHYLPQPVEHETSVVVRRVAAR